MVTGTLSLAWLPVGVLLGAAVGLVSTLAMDLPMNRLPEGPTAPKVAAGTLSGQPPGRAPAGVATAAHYGAGALVVPAVAVALFVLMNWFFLFVVVPTYDRVPGSRVSAVRRDWALSAAVYLVAATVLVGAFLALG